MPTQEKLGKHWQDFQTSSHAMWHNLAVPKSTLKIKRIFVLKKNTVTLIDKDFFYKTLQL